MIQFLEDYEDAFLNIDYVLRNQPDYAGNNGITLYTDDGKRRQFVQNFSVPDFTADLIDTVEQTTNTWDAMVSSLRQRIARRTINDRETAKRKAHMTVDTDTTQLMPARRSQMAEASPQMSEMDAFVNALAQDWRVGYRLWKELGPEIQKKVTNIRERLMPPDSGGAPLNSNFNAPNHNSGNRNRNQAPRDSPPVNRDVIRAPPKRDNGNIPMQYSSNTATAEQEIEEANETEVPSQEDDDVQTLLSFYAYLDCSNKNSHANVSVTHKAHTNYWTMIASWTMDLCITDGGADSHVGGKAWLPLTPLSGPTVKFANVIGFDEQAARKNNLPIIAAVTLAETKDGKTIMLRAKHLIYNSPSNHTLLANFQMRQLGIIVDDVHENHWKSPGEKGTHSIMFPDHTIGLTTRNALSTFKISKPTMDQYINWKEEDILDIAIENWDPQVYSDLIIEDKVAKIEIPSQEVKSIENCSKNVLTNLIFHDPMEEFLDCIEFDEIVVQNIQSKQLKDKKETVMDITSGENIEAENELYFFDAKETPKPGKVMHLSIDYQTIGKWEKGEQSRVCFMSSEDVSELIADMDWNQLTGKHMSYNTMVSAMQTTERLKQLEKKQQIPALIWKATTAEENRKLEALQPRLAWKPLEVIKKTLENTTQWGRMICQYPMKKHHVSRFPWNNRHRLREEVAMDTIFMQTPAFDGSTCEQVYFGLVSRMINVYPMPSKAHGYILKSYQDFMRYEGVPEGLHRDMAPEEKVESIIDLNRRMMVRDTYSEPDHPNQNPVESLAVKTIKTGGESILNRTGAPAESWPWVHKYMADVNNRCATPMLNWKTPISMRHGYTPDISAFLQFQFWEKIYFKIDEQHPKSKEAPGYWLGVSVTVGDALTFNVWSDKTKRVLQRSAIRSADPNKGGIPNLRVTFQEDEEEIEPEIVDPVNILDDPNLFSPPSKNSLKYSRTPKHKKQWHDTIEAPPEDLSTFVDLEEDDHPEFIPQKDDFGPKVTTDDLDQSNPHRRAKLRRGCRKAYLVATSACLTLAGSMGIKIIDSGRNINSLETIENESILTVKDPFNPNSHLHVLETNISPVDSYVTLSQDAMIRKMELQYFDTLEDEKEGSSFVPTEVLAHRLSIQPRKVVMTTGERTKVQVIKKKHVRVQTCWKNGEVSWVAANALKEQHPWVLVNYVTRNSLQNHPHFQWTKDYVKNKHVAVNLAKVKAMAAKTHQGPHFKFGVQIPMNASHALHLDKISNNKLWKESMDKEIKSLNNFSTFRVLDEGEIMPEGYIKIPYHIIFDCKFDGRRKARLVAGGHRTPSVAPEEVYSGVVSMDTI